MTIKIECCKRCSAVPLVHNSHENHYYCRHNGVLVSESISTGAMQAYTDVIKPQIMGIIRNQQMASMIIRKAAEDIIKDESSN